MPALETDLTLILDPADHSALLAARIAERDATIAANDAERKRLRAVAGGKATKPAEDAKTAALTTAATETAKHAATVAAVKVKHAAADLVAADEGHNIATGEYVLKAGPLLSGLAPIEDKRIPMTDADCDAFVASYRASVRAGFEAQDLVRQVLEYEAAHPKIDGEPGHLIPEPQALQDLRAALAAKRATVQAEQAKQGTILTVVLAAAGETAHGQRAGDSTRLDLERGNLVLGAVPVQEKVVETPVGDGKVIK